MRSTRPSVLGAVLVAALALSGPLLAATTLDYLALGDSITKGVCDTGNCPSTPNICPNASGFAGYPGRLALFGFSPACTVVYPPSAAACPTSCCVTNAGVPGEETPSMVTRIQTTPGTYDVAMVMGGTNDIFVGVLSNATIQANIGAIDTHAANRDMDPLLSSIIRYRDDVAAPGSPIANRVSDLRNLISSLAAARNRYFADPWTPLCLNAGCFDDNYYQPGSADPVGHPNGCGYDIMENTFLATIQSAPAPGVATLTSPADGSDTTDTTQLLQWNKATNATWHQLEVDGGGTGSDFFQVADSLCKTDSTCQATTVALAAGNHTWRMRGRNPRDYGGWSTTRSFEIFTAVPPVPTPSAPTGVFTSAPATFAWSDEAASVNGASSYELNIVGPVPFNGAVSPSCDGVTCSVASPVAITAGTTTWQVRSLNPVGASAWSAALPFTLYTAVPPVPTPSAPSGDFLGAPPASFVWSDESGPVNGATSYDLMIVREGNVVFNAPVSPSCGGVTCSVAPPIPITPGDYTWKTRSGNPLGTSAFSAALAFRFYDSTPGVPTPTYPIGGEETFDSTPLFQWNEVAQATDYRVQASPFDSGFVSAGTVCNSPCEIESGVSLGVGANSWTVTAKNPVGEGTPSASQSFTLLDCASFPNQSLSGMQPGTAIVKACSTITVAEAANTYTIEGPSGDVTLFAGDAIVIENGFEIEMGAELTAGTDP